MATLENTDEQQLSISGSPIAPGPAVSFAPVPELQVRTSVSSDTCQKNSSAPFWLALSLHNDMSGPITISKTTRLIDLPTAILHGCIAFRDTSDDSVVRYGCPNMSRPYMPSSRSGIPKRWNADAKDLLTLPSHGSHTIYFELTKDVAEVGGRRSSGIMVLTLGSSLKLSSQRAPRLCIGCQLQVRRLYLWRSISVPHGHKIILM